MPEVQLDEALPWSEFTAATRRAAEAEVGRSLTASQQSAFWTGKAIDFIINNPGKFIGITFKKLVYFFVGFENSDQTDIYQARNYSLLYSAFLWKNILYCPFGIILPLAGAGIALLWSRRKELLLLYLFILGYLPTVILFLVTARHRLPVIPFLIILAAGAVLKAYEYIKKKDNGRLAVPAIILAVLLIFGNKTYFDIGFENEFQTHFNLALTYSRQGNSGAAEDEYRRALELNPYSATTLNNLGFLIYQQGRVQEALTLYQRALQVDPDFAESYNNIGLVYESRGDYAGAEQYYREALKRDSRLYQAHINLGDIYLAQGKMEQAEKVYTDAYEAAPDEKNTHFKLAAFYARMQQYARGEQFFLQGKQLGEPSAFDFVNWGNIYFATDRPRQAIEKYHSAILLDPDFVQGYFNLALTFERYRLSRDSVRYYLNKLLQIDPDHANARELLQRIQ
jgi:superkiller protein 3